MTDQPTPDEALAARYFDQHIAPDDRRAGIPEHITAAARARYIRDATCNPEAVRQLHAMYTDQADGPCGCDCHRPGWRARHVGPCCKPIQPAVSRG
jgi:hypothetical protein